MKELKFKVNKGRTTTDGTDDIEVNEVEIVNPVLAGVYNEDKARDGWELLKTEASNGDA